ncbi:MAG TPA: ABC transporter permease [Hyphomicrobiaceae bacterium]|nr:ABC transporter permease [Hyphomicrobiaceae bacterium]
MARVSSILDNDASPLARLGWTLVSLAVLAAIWEFAATLLESRVLPGPVAVAATILEELRTGEMAWHLGATLARVAASFILAAVIGTAIGIALGRLGRIDRFFDSWLILFLNLPALVVIILCYVWFGLTEVAAITAVAINKIPNVAVTMREGARSLSKDLAEMAEVYKFGRWRTLRHVTLPQLTPFFLAAARSGLALVWKIVLVVELLGRSNGVGYQLNVAFQLFDVSLILAYAIAFVFVVQAIELGILQPLEMRAQRWRR